MLRSTRRLGRVPMLGQKTERTALRVGIGALTAVLMAADLVVHHTSVEKALGLVLLAVLGMATVTDLEERKIRNALVAPAAVFAVVVGLVMHASGVPAQVVAGVASGAFLLLFAVIYRGGLGMGDVKLGLVLGLFLGQLVIPALVIGLVASAIFGVAVIIRLGLARGRKTAIPLGPFLAIGGAAAVLAGPALTAHWGAW